MAKQKEPKIEPPVMRVRAAGKGERIITLAWPDGTQVELLAGTVEGHHFISLQEVDEVIWTSSVLTGEVDVG